MISNPPENTVLLLESSDIYDGWSAALLSDGSVLNRWDRNEESFRYFQTLELIDNFIKQNEATGFDDEPE